MAITIQKINSSEVKRILALQEGHFLDFKSIEIQPAKLTKAISAFANADGGDLYIGIHEDKENKKLVWSGFKTIEDANGHLQPLNDLFVLGEEYYCNFLSCGQFETLVLYLTIQKTRSIKRASGGTAYIRQGSQSLPVKDESILRKNKGLDSFESEITAAELVEVTSSEVMQGFITEAVPDANSISFLRKQGLIYKEKVAVCGVLLFSDLPQSIIPKHCGIKLYRYKTESLEGKREVLAFNPMTIEGCTYSQIHDAVRKTLEVIESLSYLDGSGLVRVKYPPETLHEIITNAVLHRDYSIADDIHIRIYENRIEVESPGKLPGHITEKNILEERFSRNGNLVRVINKFPDPPNKDIGEGLNTAFREMQKFRLRDPVIKQEENKVIVYIYHQCLASLEETILKILEIEPLVTRAIVRKVFYIETDYQLNKAFANLIKAGLIEKFFGIKGAYQRTQQDNTSNVLQGFLKSHQLQAVLNIEEALTDGSRKVMVSLPVGTGISNIGLALTYKFLKEKRYKKIFHLFSDVNSQNQIHELFSTFRIGSSGTLTNEFYLQEVKQSNSINNPGIYIGLLQNFVSNSRNRESDLSSLGDSCIITYTGNIPNSYYDILNSTGAPVIGLTFGSSESLDSFFEKNKVFNYSISQAVQDNYWVKPQYVVTDHLKKFYFHEFAQVGTFDNLNFEATLLSRAFNLDLFNFLLTQIDINKPGKTVVFCKNIRHVSVVTDIINQILMNSHAMNEFPIVAEITSNLSRQELSRTIHQFKNEVYPKIAVVVDILNSVDVASVCNLVFVRAVQSEDLYLRMLGVGARPCPEIGKKSFRIFDAVGLHQAFRNIFDGEQIILGSSRSTQSNEKAVEKVIDEELSEVESNADFTQNLTDFEMFIRNQIHTLSLLTSVIERPWTLSRIQLKVLEEQLEQSGFSREQLCSLYKTRNGYAVDDSIVGFIRHAWSKKKLVPYRERVSYAINKLQETHSLTTQQQKWIGRIKKQLELEYIVDREAFDRGAFAAQGGFQYINEMFEGRLIDIMAEIHTYIWIVP